MSTTDGDDGPSFFARYIDDPEKERPKPEIIRLRRDTEKLLDWLVNHWARPIITAREIYTFGPRSLRDKRTALSLAQILVERGLLTPVDGHDRRDMHGWSIARKPTPWFDDPACRTPIRPSAP